jgi:hypothetical protein
VVLDIKVKGQLGDREYAQSDGEGREAARDVPAANGLSGHLVE